MKYPEIKEKTKKLNTIDVLKKLRVEFPESAMTVVWDGAPYHRAKIVQEAASGLDINLQPLPAYSPDFMPVEHLWQWLREDVTYHACYDSKQDLIDAVVNFQSQINTNSLSISARARASFADHAVPGYARSPLGKKTP